MDRTSGTFSLENELLRTGRSTPEGVFEAVQTRSSFLRKAGIGAGAFVGAGTLLAPSAAFGKTGQTKANDTQTILNVAASAEVLATIVNTVGWERGLGGDAVTQRNIKAAAREELIHYQVLVATGGKPASKRIWIPDSVFANRTNLLSTLEVGDQIFVNAYLIATLTFGNAGNGTLALIASEFMGAEAVHRALARQSLGKLGNDRVFMKLDDPEGAKDAPNAGQRGFCDVLVAVAQLQAAGFGFGEPGAQPGQFYDFDEVSRRTPDDPDVNQRTPDTCDTHGGSNGHGKDEHEKKDKHEKKDEHRNDGHAGPRHG
ncbi:MAG: hypothetical protein MSC30_10305 [Gaiellaceae bacterium MAG52_C11]|nr:hypothetical protein [Candidatus Gaiellasilicea maunaloa]